MTLTLPPSLASETDEHALRALRAYFRRPPSHPGFFAGSWFDAWDSTGTRHKDRNRFTADDCLAVSCLSVTVDVRAAHELLHTRSEHFGDLLEELGDDRDLVDVEELPDEWAGWRLMADLRALPGVGPTVASKLLARKRPRLRPIYDSVVAAITHAEKSLWDPLRLELRRDNRALQERLLRLHKAAELSPDVSPLRVFDVVAWMDGKGWTAGA
jgi:hypothetical protein